MSVKSIFHSASAWRRMPIQSPHGTVGDRGQWPYRRRRSGPVSVHAGRRAVPVDIVPVESGLRDDECLAHHRHNGAVVWLTGPPASENRRWPARWSAGYSAMVFRRSSWIAILCGPALTTISVSPAGPHREKFAGWLKSLPTWRNGHIAIVAAVTLSARSRFGVFCSRGLRQLAN
jgi:hypothetical protein